MRRIFIILIICLSFIGCEKALIEKDMTNTPANNFELLWKTLDEKYSFFDFKQIDWGDMKEKYGSRVHDDMHDTALFKVLDDMLFELRDGHVNLTSSFNVSRNWEWRLNSPPNFDWDIIERNYLGDSYEITGPFRNTWIGSVGYIYYGSFSSGVSGRHLNYLVQKYKDADGIIIDIRNNGGGNLSNVERIVERLTKSKVLVGYSKFRNGPEHGDFTSPEPLYAEPHEEDVSVFELPVVVLTNRSSYSASNDFTLKTMALPQVTVMGDTTGGGGGFPFHAELLNGWTYRFSTSVTLDVDGVNIEDGIAPDILIQTSPGDEQNGIDTILEEALEFLK